MNKGKLFPQSINRSLIPDLFDYRWQLPRQVQVAGTFYPSTPPFSAVIVSEVYDDKVDGTRLVYKFPPSTIWWPGTTVEWYADATNDLEQRGVHCWIRYPNGTADHWTSGPWGVEQNDFRATFMTFYLDTVRPPFAQFIDDLHYYPISYNEFPKKPLPW